MIRPEQKGTFMRVITEKEIKLNQLRQYQALSLKGKIRLSEMRIHEWVERFGQGGCYISMSGGKDFRVEGYLNHPNRGRYRRACH